MSKIFTIAEGLENLGALRTGGQGSVYKGRRIGPIFSAVKLLPTPIFAENTKDRNYRNFLNEVEKLKKVNEVPNPNVVKILNSGITESGSFPFIEMEFIEGPDLEELLKSPNDKVFTLKEIIKVADQLAGALAHCHNVGVKHGDIKSNNVKFNINSGNYVLLDFGLSVMSDEERRSSMRHAGAIEFMAPEQNEGKMLFQTDIYSYGVILFELLAGQVPFPLADSGETARNAVMVAHMESPVPDLLKLREQNLPDSWNDETRKREMHVPSWLLSLIARCLEKKYQNRYNDGMALRDAIIENSIADIRADKITPENVIEEEEQALIPPAMPPIDTDDGSVIRMSVPVFVGLVILLLGSMGFCGYLLFKQPVQSVEKHTVIDSAKTPEIVDSSNKKPVHHATSSYLQKKRATDSVVHKAIEDEVKRARQQSATEPDSTAVDTTGNQPEQN